MSRESNCARCGHPQDWHRHDDADDYGALAGTLEHQQGAPLCRFRCIGHDCEVGGWDGRGCDDKCPDYVAPPVPSTLEPKP